MLHPKHDTLTDLSRYSSTSVLCISKQLGQGTLSSVSWLPFFTAFSIVDHDVCSIKLFSHSHKHPSRLGYTSSTACGIPNQGRPKRLVSKLSIQPRPKPVINTQHHLWPIPTDCFLPLPPTPVKLLIYFSAAQVKSRHSAAAAVSKYRRLVVAIYSSGFYIFHTLGIHWLSGSSHRNTWAVVVR